MPAYGDSREVSLPITEKTAYSVLSLPVYGDMTDEECDLFVEGIRRAHHNAEAIGRRS